MKNKTIHKRHVDTKSAYEIDILTRTLPLCKHIIFQKLYEQTHSKEHKTLLDYQQLQIYLHDPLFLHFILRNIVDELMQLKYVHTKNNNTKLPGVPNT